MENLALSVLYMYGQQWMFTIYKKLLSRQNIELFINMCFFFVCPDDFLVKAKVMEFSTRKAANLEKK